MSIKPKPMDPERLAQMRSHLTAGRGPVAAYAARELLDDRDHCEAAAMAVAERLRERVDQVKEMWKESKRARAEAKMWRDQCLVTAEHVEAAGVTPAHASEWARAEGWRESDDETWPSAKAFGMLRLSRPGEKRECTACLFDDGEPDNLDAIARLCNEAAKDDSRCPHDILAEMAALAAEPSR